MFPDGVMEGTIGALPLPEPKGRGPAMPSGRRSSSRVVTLNGQPSLAEALRKHLLQARIFQEGSVIVGRG